MSSITRRSWLALSGLAATTACGRRHGAGFAGYALIATAGEPSTAVVDLSTFRLVRRLPVGGAPTAVFADAHSRTSYVLTPQTGSVHAIDASLTLVGSRRVGDDLSGMRLSRDGRHLFVSSRQSRELIEIDARTLRVGRRWKLAAEPLGLDVSITGLVAVSTGVHGIVELIDSKTGRQYRRDLNGELGSLQFRADGNAILLANWHEKAITALAAPDLQLIVHLPLAMQPENLCFNFDGGQLFVTGGGMDGVAIAFPYYPLEIEQTVLAGRDPGAMACSSNPAYLFVASASGSDVCILNIENRKMIGIVEVGQKPSFIAITPDNQYALVLNQASGDLAVIHITSLRAKMSNPAKMRSKAVAALFTMLPVGDKPVHAAIVPKTA